MNNNFWDKQRENDSYMIEFSLKLNFLSITLRPGQQFTWVQRLCSTHRSVKQNSRHDSLIKFTWKPLTIQLLVSVIQFEFHGKFHHYNRRWKDEDKWVSWMWFPPFTSCPLLWYNFFNCNNWISRILRLISILMINLNSLCNM